MKIIKLNVTRKIYSLKQVNLLILEFTWGSLDSSWRRHHWTKWRRAWCSASCTLINGCFITEELLTFCKSIWSQFKLTALKSNCEWFNFSLAFGELVLAINFKVNLSWLFRPPLHGREAAAVGIDLIAQRNIIQSWILIEEFFIFRVVVL